jgi:hypothetical protein
LFLHRRCSAVGTLFWVFSASLVAGCGAFGLGQSGVDGFWKGQLIEEGFAESGMPLESRENRRPRRILLRLEEGSGIVEGRFAQSSDAVAFRLIGEEGSRSVAAYPVTGTLDGTRLHIRFPAETGLTYEVDAIVGERVIEGSYIARDTSADSQQTLSGRFEVERF